MKRHFIKKPIMAEISLDSAMNPNTPVEMLAEWANDADYHMRSYVAKNPSTPVEVLAELANDKIELVRWYVARNPNTRPEILAKLAEDKDSDVRESAMKNPNTPPEILAKLGYKSTNSNKSNKSSKKQQEDIIQQFQNLNWDDMYEDEQFDAEMNYLADLEADVFGEMGLWIEPSIQGNQGGVWIYTEGDDEIVVDGYDYQDYVNEVIDIALDSNNEADFKQKFISYVNGLMEDYN